MTQMFLAGTAAVLLAGTGLSPATLVATAVATLVSIACWSVTRARR